MSERQGHAAPIGRAAWITKPEARHAHALEAEYMEREMQEINPVQVLQWTYKIRKNGSQLTQKAKPLTIQLQMRHVLAARYTHSVRR